MARIVAFVAGERAIRPGLLSPDATLLGDLGMDGADGWELIEAFGRAFEVDVSRFEPARHFGPEGGGSPLSLIIWLTEVFLGGRDVHEVWGLSPITIRDLAEAAERKCWLT